MRIIVDDNETAEVVGTRDEDAIVHKNDVIRHANRLRAAGAKKMHFELTSKEADSIGEIPRGKDFRVTVAGEATPSFPAA